MKNNKTIYVSFNTKTITSRKLKEKLEQIGIYVNTHAIDNCNESSHHFICDFKPNIIDNITQKFLDDKLKNYQMLI